MTADGWTRVSLGSVSHQVSEHERDPAAAGLERYVGLEHLDPEHITVERWGSIADGTTFTKRFQVGQLLFAKRRAYQRKAAVADFDGLCSGDLIVIEAKPEALLPELLPYIVHTDRFLDHALRTSSGSLSPRTKWKDLAEYEFDLPSLDRQREIVAQLEAATVVVQRLEEARRTTLDLTRAIILRHYRHAIKHGSMASVSSLGQVTMGRQKSPKYMRGVNPRPYLSVANIGYLELDLDDVAEMDFTDEEMKIYELRPGDVLLSEGDLISPRNVGRPAIFRGEPANTAFQNTLLRFRSNDQLDPEYALLVFEGTRLTGEFARVSGRTSITHLGLRRFATLEMPVVARTSQREPVDQLTEARGVLQALGAQRKATTQLLRTLGRRLLT